MKKETRTQRILRKQRAIRNATANSKLASKAKFWSDEKILRELGIKIPKSTPKLKVLPKDPKKLQAFKTRKSREQRNVKYAIEIGLKPKQAYKVKKYKKSKIKATKQYKSKLEVTSRKFKTPKSREGRSKLWTEWSVNENLPPEVHEMAREVNRTVEISVEIKGVKKFRKIRRLDDTDKYGYMIAYYMFITGWDKDRIMELNPVDRYDGNRYVDNIAVMV